LAADDGASARALASVIEVVIAVECTLNFLRIICMHNQIKIIGTITIIITLKLPLYSAKKYLPRRVILQGNSS
jgi:hypothetical protein